MNKPIIIISGGFDPIHIGHIRMIKEAKNMSSKLIIIANNDIWLEKKKGYVFMPEEERLEILRALCRNEDFVLLSFHKEGFIDRSVCDELRYIRKHNDGHIIFGNGGDRISDNVPEVHVCKELNIEMIYNVGGEKIQSSSHLVNKHKQNEI